MIPDSQEPPLTDATQSPRGWMNLASHLARVSPNLNERNLPKKYFTFPSLPFLFFFFTAHLTERELSRAGGKCSQRECGMDGRMDVSIRGHIFPSSSRMDLYQTSARLGEIVGNRLRDSLRLPLAAGGGEFTQPRANLLAEPCTLSLDVPSTRASTNGLRSPFCKTPPRNM